MMCTSSRKSPASGYNKVTVSQLLVHLISQNGDINPKNTADNDKRFSKLWDGAEPFEK
jgi:hypothetical protein